VGLIAVPIWLRYEGKSAPSDGSAVSGGVGQSYLTTNQQEVSTPGETSARSDTPTVDWDGSALNGDVQTTSKSVEIRHKLSSVDWIGSTLMIASSTSFLVGLSLGGNKYPWRDSAVLVPIIAGLTGIVITVMYE
jgi:hypothetical protein